MRSNSASTYNSRLQLSQTYGAVAKNGIQVLYINNLQSVAEQVASSGIPSPQSSLVTFTDSFTYDSANRLQTASDTGGWSRTLNYDPYGNMWVGPAAGTLPGPFTATSNIYKSATNQRKCGRRQLNLVPRIKPKISSKGIA